MGNDIISHWRTVPCQKRDLFPPVDRNKSSEPVHQSENGGGHDKSGSFYPNEIDKVGVWRQKKDIQKEKNRGHIQ